MLMKLKDNIAVSNSGFVFNPTTGDSFSVNPIGEFMIQLLKEGKSKEEIVSDVIETYKIDADTVEKDLYDFTKMLATYKLIQEDNE